MDISLGKWYWIDGDSRPVLIVDIPAADNLLRGVTTKDNRGKRRAFWFMKSQVLAPLTD